jgi:hypothetical protein
LTGGSPHRSFSYVSDSVIDLNEYLRRRAADGDPQPAATFALWGADGERSRFALPLWRSIFLAGAERGGILWTDSDRMVLHPLVVLDLARDPARTDFRPWMLDVLRGEDAPEVVEQGLDPHMAIFLGEREGRWWFLVVDGGPGKEGPLPARDREDILFLAGECAGLLFLRDFADDVGGREE